MPSGLSRPYGHQGLVDDDSGSGSTPPPPASGFLSTIYAAGLADDPTVDNLLVGPTTELFFNLGSTPPPFPPTNPLFFPISGLAIGEAPANDGVGADANPLIRTRRHFTTFPSLGDHYNVETRYDLFAGGINTITGGDRTLHVVVDQFENRLTEAIDSTELTRPGLFAPGYNPIYLDGAPITYKHWALLDALGGGNANTWSLSSDGGMYRIVFLPNTIGPGGGPAGPWDFVANGMSMWSRNGGEPLVGSTLWYDAVSVQTGRQFESSAGQCIVMQGAVLDVKNLGSGQAGGHAETWIRSTLGGALTLVMQAFDSGIVFPQGFAATDDVTFAGGTTTTFNSGAVFAGSFTSNVTAFFNSGIVNTGGIDTDQLIVSAGGDADVAGEVIAGEDVRPFGGTGAVLWGKTVAIDLLATGPTSISFPLIAGKVPIVLSSRWIKDSLTGAAVGNVTYTIGTNAATYDNLNNGANTISAASFNAAAVGGAIQGFTLNTGSPDMGSQCFVNISAAFTGATVATGHLAVFAVYA